MGSVKEMISTRSIKISEAKLEALGSEPLSVFVNVYLKGSGLRRCTRQTVLAKGSDIDADPGWKGNGRCRQSVARKARLNETRILNRSIKNSIVNAT